MRFVLLALLIAGTAFASTPLPEPIGYVNDFAGVLSVETKEALETKLAAFDASTTNQVAVVTVPSLNGDYIEHYAEQLFQLWGIGTTEKNNGALLIIAVNDKQFRIEVGYGLEGALTDGEAKQIMDAMTPFLKVDDYDGALAYGVDGIIVSTEGEYSSDVSQEFDLESLFPIFFFTIIALQWVVAVLARSKSYWGGGVVGALAGIVVSSLVGWWLYSGLLLTGVLVLVGLALDFAVSRAYSEAKSSGGHPPWWTGGSGGFGSGSSGGGFGGFGGGSSGGGGASGSC